MNIFKIIAAGAAMGVIAIAFRDSEHGRWLFPSLPGRARPVLVDDAEPVLGYDGMDVDTLLDWLDDAELEEDTLLHMREYEEENFGREAVLDAIDALLG